MTDTLPSKDIYCHLTGFNKKCRDIVVKCKCRKWVHWIGHDPQTNQPVDLWDCRDHVDHVLQIATIQAIRQSTGSIDNFRKEVAVQNDATMVTLLKNMNDRLEEEQQRLNGPAPHLIDKAN